MAITLHEKIRNLLLNIRNKIHDSNPQLFYLPQEHFIVRFLKNCNKFIKNFLLKLCNINSPIFYIAEEKYTTRLFYLLRHISLHRLCNITHKPVHNKLDNIIFPIQIRDINLMKHPEKLFSNEILGIIKHTNYQLLFDLSIEAIIFEGYSEDMLQAFHNWLEKSKIDSKRIILINANSKSNRGYNNWVNQNNIKYRIRIYGYDFYLFEYHWEVLKNIWFIENQNNLISVSKLALKGKKRNKHFMCLNLRPRTHRTAIVLHLLDRGFLEKGIVTYFGQEFGNPSVESDTETVKFISTLSSGKRLLAQHDILNTLTPITFERNSNQVRKDLWERNIGEVDFLIPEAKHQEILEHVDTYFEIVNETWFPGSEDIYITEKTIRPMLRLQFFIHVGCPGVIKYLKKLGFKTFSPYVDETYDSILNPQERMEAIFKEIDKLCSMSIDEIHQLYCDLWPIIEHNFNHFTKNMRKLCKEEISNMLKNL